MAVGHPLDVLPSRPATPGWEQAAVLHVDGAWKAGRCGAAWFAGFNCVGAASWSGANSVAAEAGAAVLGLEALRLIYDGPVVVACDNVAVIRLVNDPTLSHPARRPAEVQVLLEWVAADGFVHFEWTPSHSADTLDEHRLCHWLAEEAREVAAPVTFAAPWPLCMADFAAAAEVVDATGMRIHQAFRVARKTARGVRVRRELGLPQERPDPRRNAVVRVR